MATITGLITVNDKKVLEVDADPSAGGGTAADIGSVAMLELAGVGSEYLKVGAADTAWDRVLTANTSSVADGTYLRLPIYDTDPNGPHVADEVAQNTQPIHVFLEAQPTRSAGIDYRIPNPGDAITAADFILSEGAQTKNGDMTFTDDVVVNGDLTVNGTLTFLNSTNTDITDKLITLNKGGGATSGAGSGFEIEEGGAPTAFIKVGAGRASWSFKVPTIAFAWDLDLSLLTAARTVKAPDSGGTMVLRPNATVQVAGQVAYWSDGNNITSEAAFFYDATNDRLGIGTNTPARTLDVNGNSLFHGAMLQNDATATAAKWEQLQATVLTTDATVTTLATIAIPTDSEVLLVASITGRRTGGSAGTAGDSAAYVRTARIKNVAGTVTITDLQTDYTSEDQKAWDGTIDVNSTNARVRIKGAVNNNVTWTATYQVITL